MEDNNVKKTERIPRFWYTFTTVIIILGSLSLFGSILFSLSEGKWNLFYFALGGYVFLLLMCAIIQLLVKIEQNTRK